jgi:two-component system sensor histidine kinase DegS
MQVGKKASASSHADLESQFVAIVASLQNDLAQLSESIGRFRDAYQRKAEASQADSDSTTLDQLRESLRRLRQLELVEKHIGASVSYLYDTGQPLEQHDEVRDFAARILDGLEAERQRLYRDVHDGPAQVLTNGIFEIEFFERVAERAPADVRAPLMAELANLKMQFRESLEDVRGVILDLRPPALAQLGLAEAMRAYGAEFQFRHGLALQTDLRVGPTGLTPQQELAIYRVFQEALHNVRKHSRAQTVRVGWDRVGGQWTLTVSDDGVGFDLARVRRQTKSVGLLTMRERAEVIGATLDVRSNSGAGTSVILTLPAAA